MSVQVLAMHGWGRQPRLGPLGRAGRTAGLAAARGGAGLWGPAAAATALGASSQQRILLGHSLGPHLLEPGLWAEATAAVLLASFAGFVPEGRAGRPLRTALNGMAAQLEHGDGPAMLASFLERVAFPFRSSELPQGPLQQGIGAAGTARLLEDLQRLAATTGLPEGLRAALPRRLPVLIVEAEDDQIVCAASRAQLRALLPEATVISLPRAGHGLLGAGVPAMVLDWIADGLA